MTITLRRLTLRRTKDFGVAIHGLWSDRVYTLDFIRFASQEEAQAWIDNMNIRSVSGMTEYVVVDLREA